jgi:hypothetical protein
MANLTATTDQMAHFAAADRMRENASAALINPGKTGDIV